MPLLRTLAFACHLLGIVTAVAFGLTYLLRGRFLPYHAIALGKEWTEVPREVQVLVLALMRVAAGGALAVAALESFVLMFPFRAGAFWALWAVPLSYLLLTGCSLSAMRLVASNTPARPPYGPVLVSAALSLVGLALSLAGG